MITSVIKQVSYSRHIGIDMHHQRVFKEDTLPWPPTLVNQEDEDILK